MLFSFKDTDKFSFENAFIKISLKYIFQSDTHFKFIKVQFLVVNFGFQIKVHHDVYFFIKVNNACVFF